LVVSLKEIKGLSGISKKGGALHVGATTKLKDLAANKDARSAFPALITAIENIGSAQMINMGSVGGDLLQRPRCWYYRNGLGLLAMQDGESLVAKGENRYHAIFANDGAAKFVHASSLAPVLIALGATVHVAGPNGKRAVDAAEFFSIPTSESDRESVLASNEVLTSVEVPMNGRKNGLYEIRQRTGLDWPMVAAAIAFDGSASRATNVRIVLGHVAPVPWHSEAGSKALEGKAVNEANLDAAAAAALNGAKPLSGNAYKVPQAKVAIRRAGLAAIA
jgi:xanthine dehydrogenase YagS FAD-binding subunit